MSVTVEHVTVQRIRFKFPRSLKPEEFDLLRSTFSSHFPRLFLFPSSLRSGCVIRAADEETLNPDLLLDFLKDFFTGSFPQGPPCPPSRLESFRLQTIQVGIKASLVMAILGWMLPVLPGTPFSYWRGGWVGDLPLIHPRNVKISQSDSI